MITEETKWYKAQNNILQLMIGCEKSNYSERLVDICIKLKDEW